MNSLAYLSDTIAHELGPRSNSVRNATITMKSAVSAKLPVSNSKKSIFLVFLMLISSMSPMLIISPVSAHETANDVIWPKQGSNDTGWVQLDAVGANPTIGMQASANWGLNFAPGAEISNLTMEVRVNGSDNLMIEEPIITAADIGINLFDWSGLGMLGSSDSFDGMNPHSGRLSPNSEAGAVWTLPSGAEITELIVEALAPVDPAVSFEPVNIEITDYAVHFVDGRLYLAVSDSLLIIDYNNDPKIIDIVEFGDGADIIDIGGESTRPGSTTINKIKEWNRVKNIIETLKLAREIGIYSLGFLGNGGGDALEYCDAAFIVPSKITARIQESHITAGHAMLQYIEDTLLHEGWIKNS